MPFVQQGHSAILTPDAVALPIASSAKWLLTRFDIFVDSGMSFAERGANGWGVEPAPGGTVRVTAPLLAVVGDDYDARLSITAAEIDLYQNGHATATENTTQTEVGQGQPGQSGSGSATPTTPPTPPTLRTASFSVSAYVPPPPPAGSTMPRHLFSTGLLICSAQLPKPSLSRVTKGAPAAATQPVANLLDDSYQTLTDLTQTNAANFTYLVLDFGASQAIGRIIAGNVAVSGGGTLKCYASATLISTGDFTSATALPQTANADGMGNDNEFVPNGGTVSARYVYLVPDSSTGATIGDLDVRASEFRIGTLQSVAPSFSCELKMLHGAAWLNQWAVADANTDAKAELTADTAQLDENTVNLFTGALISALGSNPMTATGSRVAKPPTFVAELRTQDSAGRPVTIIFYEAVAPGFVWGMKRDDFSVPSFKLMTYLDAAQNRAWRIRLRQ